MNDLPGVNLVVADAGGGQMGGVIVFYFQLRGEDGKWRVADKFTAPLLAAHKEDKTLVFEVHHHKTHGSPDFGPNVNFCMELTAEKEALLSNLDAPLREPTKLVRGE